MKSLITSLLTLVVAFAISSCDNSDDTDSIYCNWPAFEWEKHNYSTVKVNDNYEYIRVPAEGGDYMFQCKNYRPWINHAMTGLVGMYATNRWMREEGDNNIHHLSFPGGEAIISGHILRVVIGPNEDEHELDISIILQVGNAFDNIGFRQDATVK